MTTQRTAMTLLRSFLLALFLLGVSVPASAQFGGIKKPKLPSIGSSEEKKEEATETATSSASEQQAKESSTGSRLDELVFDAPFRPAIMHSSLLKGGSEGVGLLKDGTFTLGDIIGVFLPTTTTSGENAGYGSNDGDFRIVSVLTTEGGDEIQRNNWVSAGYEVNAANPYFRRLTPHIGSLNKLKPGSYTLDFSIEGDHFYSFPFRVVELVKGDAYNPMSILGIDGDWNDYIYVYIADNRPDEGLYFKRWLRNDKKQLNIKEYNADVSYTLKRDGAVIGTSPKQDCYVNRIWQRKEFMFEKVKNEEGGLITMKGSDLLNHDGDYEITMTFDGTTTNYRFTVKDGAIVHQGRQDRGEADPMTMIEGGRDAYWIRQE